MSGFIQSRAIPGLRGLERFARQLAMEMLSGLGVVRLLLAGGPSALIALRSWQKKSLSTSGAVAGAVVLTLSLMAGPRFEFFSPLASIDFFCNAHSAARGVSLYANICCSIGYWFSIDCDREFATCKIIT